MAVARGVRDALDQAGLPQLTAPGRADAGGGGEPAAHLAVADVASGGAPVAGSHATLV